VISAYTETVKNITVTVDDNTYRRARVRAAQLDTSVSALVRQFLIDFAEGESESESDRLKREEQALRAHISHFTAADRLSRDDVHVRGL
jgi:plasmid stability protein